MATMNNQASTRVLAAGRDILYFLRNNNIPLSRFILLHTSFARRLACSQVPGTRMEEVLG
jgi:hypothetical protein